MTFHAIIPAGGAGTRLWPLSRRAHPKFLHDLTGSGRSLLSATVDRLRPVATTVTVVTGTAHVRAVRAEVPELGPASVLAEPSPKDSMAAIGLAAAVLARRYPEEDVVVGSFAADHVIRNQGAFAAAVGAAEAAARAGYVATIGIEPTGPSSAFGYIEIGAALPDVDAQLPVHRVQGFTEKPDHDTARAYLDNGGYRWNAGMFISRADVLLDHLATTKPDLAAGLADIAAAWDGPDRQEVMARCWPLLEAISIDHAVAEPVAARGAMAVVPGDFGWNDVGDWASVREVLPPENLGRRDDDAALDGAAPYVLGRSEQTLALDSPGAVLVPGTGRTVAVVGIPDAVVIDTEDAVLVTTAANAQQVKDAVQFLSERGRADLL